MSIITPSLPSGFVIFCDDIRREDNGKLIYIGVYGADMLIPGPFPALLPTFCALTTYREAPGETEPPVTLKLFIPGLEEAAATAHVPVEQMRNVRLPPATEQSSPSLNSLIQLKISPLILYQEGLIRVRAYRGDDEIRLGSLLVKLLQPPEI
jgi:hypothetical protein